MSAIALGHVPFGIMGLISFGFPNLESLVYILHTGNECLINGKEFPAHWLFHRRWSKAKAKAPKDHNDKTVKFISSGGRTAAFVPTIQKLKKRKASTDKDVASEKIEKKGSRSSKRKKSS